MIIIKEIMIFPVIIVLDMVRALLDLIIKAECWVAGVGFLLLAIFSVIALFEKMWLQLFVFGILLRCTDHFYLSKTFQPLRRLTYY